jgi:DNA-binding NarL/FixJ family response regulator
MSPAEAVQAALKPIAAGASAPQPSPGQKLLSILSPREREVLRYVARGLSAKEIGEALFISVATVRTHSENIRNKFDLDNERALIAFIHENKLV